MSIKCEGTINFSRRFQAKLDLAGIEHDNQISKTRMWKTIPPVGAKVEIDMPGPTLLCKVSSIKYYLCKKESSDLVEIILEPVEDTIGEDDHAGIFNNLVKDGWST